MALSVGDKVEVQTSKMMYPEVVAIELILSDEYFGWSYNSNSFVSFSKKDIINFISSIRRPND